MLLCQLVASAISVKMAAVCGFIEYEPITLDLVSRFVIVPLAFLGAM